MRRRARTDANQKAIVEALEASGWLVLSLASLGRGKPDLLIFKPSTQSWGLIEVKSAKGKLRPLQEDFAAKGWPVAIVRSAEDVL